MSRAERDAWIAGIIGLAGALIGWVVAPSQVPHAWLAALTAWIGWPLGSMALLLTHALTGGRWGYAVRPALVGGVCSLPLLIPALIPFLLTMPALYPWTHADTASHLANHFYLNVPFFAGRGIVYLLVWFGLAGLILRALRSAEADPMLERLAPAGLILLALTVTFAAIDTTMSLDPDFSSSAYGMIAAAGAGLFALAVAVLLTAAALPPAEIRADLGKLLLGLVVLWAYLDFMQVLIVWQSDLASEAPWYSVRSTPFWAVIAALVAAAHFALPFAMLLSPALQRSRRCMLCVAGLLIVAEILYSWWLVLPAAPRGLRLIDPAAMLAFGGCGVGLALRLRPRPLAAVAHHG
ncbi:MAG: hypothetical protein JO264_11895 [Acidisphaera sp.]|nr:hypothetical protein [Acidisphaera sp.]